MKHKKQQRGHTVGHSKCILYCTKGLWCTSCGTTLFWGVRSCVKGYCFAVYTLLLLKKLKAKLYISPSFTVLKMHLDGQRISPTSVYQLDSSG